MLNDAKNIANSYKSGPISFGIYIDRDYRTHSNLSIYEFNKIFNDTFYKINNKYDIIIGILYINTSSLFWQKRKFFPSTAMMHKIPTNSLRNLAEYQISTKWLLNIDIDFMYFSNTLNDENYVKKYLLSQINEYYQHFKETIFIIPSFEIIINNTFSSLLSYSNLNKSSLLNLVFNKKEIIPFHEKMLAQQCTNYNKWYILNLNKKYYKLNYSNYKINCSLYYEPWYIINTKISKKYPFNNNYIGRGLNKVERTFNLRHNCFNFIVLNNIFIIHSSSLHLIKKNPTNQDKIKWHRFNFNIFIQQKLNFYSTQNSCSYNYYQDSHCYSGIISKNLISSCNVCCHISCKKCVECDDDKNVNNDNLCCIQNIIKSQRYCNQSLPPCVLNGRYCNN